MAAGLRVGVNMFLYRNTGTYAVPVWNPVTGAMDVNLGLGKSKAEIKARVSKWKLTMPAIKEGPLTFGLLGDTSLDDWNAFRDAHIADTLMDLAIADDAIATAGTDYFRGEYYVYEFPVDQKLEEANNAQVGCDLGYSANVPAWTDVA